MRSQLTILTLGNDCSAGIRLGAGNHGVGLEVGRSGHRQTTMRRPRADFEAAHPGVTVNYVMQPHDQYYTLLGTALSSNAGPDLFLMNGGAQARARMDALVKLDDKVADVKDGIVGWPEFTGPDGGLYAVPLSIQGFVVYYNKKLYADAGLDPAKAAATWAELTKVCDAIKAKGAVPCFALGNKEGFGVEFWFSVDRRGRMDGPASRPTSPPAS